MRIEVNNPAYSAEVFEAIDEEFVSQLEVLGHAAASSNVEEGDFDNVMQEHRWNEFAKLDFNDKVCSSNALEGTAIKTELSRIEADFYSVIVSMFGEEEIYGENTVADFISKYSIQLQQPGASLRAHKDRASIAPATFVVQATEEATDFGVWLPCRSDEPKPIKPEPHYMYTMGLGDVMAIRSDWLWPTQASIPGVVWHGSLREQSEQVRVIGTFLREYIPRGD